MRYPDSVEYLYALGNEIKSAKLGLDRIRVLLAGLGSPQAGYRIVHVGGTNGKGSVSAMIASGLRAAGLRTGLYTSPHLLEPTERIRLDGAEISRDSFLEAFQTVHAEAEAMLARGELEAHPTYFETLTAMAFLVFSRSAVDVAVMEVGLGGRLDATNVVEPELTVLTAIGYDHEAWLGHSIQSIATEKAGIFKPGVPALSSPQLPEAWEVLRDRARELGIRLHESASWVQEDLRIHQDGSRFSLRREGRLLRIDCPLRGAFQAGNARTAAAALGLIGIETGAIERGIREVRWPGRLEKVSTRPDVYLDGAHNPAGCAALASYIRMMKGDRKVWLVFGLMRDKAVSEMADLLFPLADHLVLTAPKQPRALRPEALAEHAGGAPHLIVPDMEAALEIVRAAPPDDLVFIAGSLFLVAEAYGLLGPEFPE